MTANTPTPERMTPEAALEMANELGHISADLRSCVAFLPPVGRRNIRKHADRLLDVMHTLAALAQRVEEMEAERRVWLDANELLVKWKGTIDEARIVRRLPFPPDYDRSPAYAIASLLTHEREAAEARADALEKEAGRYRHLRQSQMVYGDTHESFDAMVDAAMSEVAAIDRLTPTPSEADDHGRR